jgi:hypothetical protein
MVSNGSVLIATKYIEFNKRNNKKGHYKSLFRLNIKVQSLGEQFGEFSETNCKTNICYIRVREM